MEAKILKTGTTNVGILGKDFVVLAAERQATSGGLVAGYEKKLARIENHIVMTKVGAVGDSDVVIRFMEGVARRWRIDNGRPIPVRAFTTFLSNIFNANRWFPYFTAPLIGGYYNGPELYSVDAIGGVLKAEDFVVIGSGGSLAVAVLEDAYSKDITPEEAIDLARRAITASRKRDVYSGGPIDVAVVTKKGIEEKTL